MQCFKAKLPELSRPAKRKRNGADVLEYIRKYITQNNDIKVVD
jgi:hypothetical protein